MYFVYILECADGSYYTGIATDVDRRFAQHQQGKGARYTSVRGAKRIVFTEKQPDRSSALKREAQIKRLTRQQKDHLVQYPHAEKGTVDRPRHTRSV